MSEHDLKIELVPIDDLTPSANNAKIHTEEQIDQIAASIKAFKFNNPILVDGDNSIIAGEGRYKAAKKLKLKQVPVIRLDHLSPAEQRAYMLADNKLTLNTGLDFEMLTSDFDMLKEADFDLSLTGFNPDEITELLAKPDFSPAEPGVNKKLDTPPPPPEIECPACHHRWILEK